MAQINRKTAKTGTEGWTRFPQDNFPTKVVKRLLTPPGNGSPFWVVLSNPTVNVPGGLKVWETEAEAINGRAAKKPRKARHKDGVTHAERTARDE